MENPRLYLKVPPYLAQWYANECYRGTRVSEPTCDVLFYNFRDPVLPIRGSEEFNILKVNLTKQPETPEPVNIHDANLVIALPFFRTKDPRTYSYLRPKAQTALITTLHARFRNSMFREVLLQVEKSHNARKDLAIEAWMDLHGIEPTDTNYQTILKMYNRRYDVYRKGIHEN